MAAADRSGQARGARIVILDGEHGAAVYLHNGDGTWWRVYDCAFGPPLAQPGRRVVLTPPSGRATDRWFVGRDGVRRVYHFQRGDHRELEPRLLVAQLAGARFGARLTGPDERTPHMVMDERGDLVGWD